jgi:hypothetical protein
VTFDNDKALDMLAKIIVTYNKKPRTNFDELQEIVWSEPYQSVFFKQKNKSNSLCNTDIKRNEKD